MPRVLEPSPSELFVTLEIRLVTWKFFAFTMKSLPLDTVLLRVSRAVQAEHGGSLRGISVWVNQVSPNPPITNMEATLAEIGIQGGPADNPPTVRLYYDFTPSSSDPLVMATLPAA